MKDEGYQIVVTTGNTSEYMSEQEFAARLADHHLSHGKQSLETWLNDHDLTFQQALELIGTEAIERSPDGVFENGQRFSPIALLLDIEKQYRAAESPKSDVESAMQGHVTGELRLKQLAENADRMTTAQLEEAIAQAGMTINRSTLTR